LTDYFSLATGLDKIGASQTSASASASPGLKGGIGDRYDDFGNLRTSDAAPVIQPVDYFAKATGLDKIGAPSESPTIDPNATPDAPTWLGRRVQDIEGKQDPRFKDVGTVFDQFRGELRGPTATAATFGAGDEAMADIVQKNLGDKFIRREKDANGYDIFVTKGPDGKEQKGYLNKPGLDLEDVARAGYGSLPYLAVGGVTGKVLQGAGMGLRAAGQFIANGATSLAGDVGNMVQGSEQGIDIPKAGVVGTFGAAAEPVSSVVGSMFRRFWIIPGLIDKSSGQLTAKGIAAAKEAGVDPTQISPDFAKAFAQSMATTGDPAAAATQAGLDRFGIPATRGQITKDPYLLTQEEGMRRRLYGQGAQDTMLGFDRGQQDAIKRSALGSDGTSASPPIPSAPSQGIGEQLNPGRQPGANPNDIQPATLGNSVQDAIQGARQNAARQESLLWDDKVKDLSATPKALNNLRPHISSALADETAFTPTGQKMAEAIGEFAEGTAPTVEAGGVQLKPIKSVDQMRRHLGKLVGSAEDGSDKHQAGKIYDAFNDWIGDSASKALLDGDPAAAMQIVKARGFTKSVRELFQPRAKDGTLTPSGNRISKILDNGKADSGEAVIDTILGSGGSTRITGGTVGAVTNIKKALDTFADPAAGKQAWDDIRLAYWSRLVLDKSGKLYGPTAIQSNLNRAFHGQSSLMQALYSPLEMRSMREFELAISAVAYKPPNASGSGYTAASFIKDGLMKIVDSFGLGGPARAALKGFGIEDAFGAAAAKQAVQKIVRPIRPNLAPITTSTGSALYNGRPQSPGG